MGIIINNQRCHRPACCLAPSLSATHPTHRRPCPPQSPLPTQPNPAADCWQQQSQQNGQTVGYKYETCSSAETARKLGFIRSCMLYAASFVAVGCIAKERAVMVGVARVRGGADRSKESNNVRSILGLLQYMQTMPTLPRSPCQLTGAKQPAGSEGGSLRDI